MKKDLLYLSAKAFIVGVSFAVGALATTAIAVTVSATFTSGDTLTAASMNVIKSAIESIPDWTKSGSDAVYTAGNVGIGTTTPGSKLSVVGLIAYADDATAAGALSTGDFYTITGSTAIHVVP